MIIMYLISKKTRFHSISYEGGKSGFKQFDEPNVSGTTCLSMYDYIFSFNI